MRGLKVAVTAAMIFFCCLIPLGSFFLDSSLRDIGILPSYTFTPSSGASDTPRPVDRSRKTLASVTLSPLPAAYTIPTLTDAPPTARSATVMVENANLRSGPGVNYAVIGYVKMGDQLLVYGQNENGKWLQIDREGQEWIKASLVEVASETATPVSMLSRAVNLPGQETSPTLTPDFLIIDVTALIGAPVDQVEEILGEAILITPNNDRDDALAGGEYRDYMIGKYRVFLSFDKDGMVRGFQVLEGLIEDNYSLSDWRAILPRFGVHITDEPDKIARVALYWYNYHGYGIALAANNMSGRPVWSVQIEQADIFLQ